MIKIYSYETGFKEGNSFYSPFPTNTNFMMCWIKMMEVDSIIDKYFLKNSSKLMMVFANPEDISYNNFENILFLNNYFSNNNINNISSNIKNITKLSKSEVIFDMVKFQIDSKLLDVLLNLEKLNFYNIPLNSASRGGKRFIFSSKSLAKHLEYLLHRKIFDENNNTTEYYSLDMRLTSDKKYCTPEKRNFEIVPFKKINKVFRFNKFEKNDKKFSSHFDVPYTDSNKNLHSLFTIIIYLTDGNNEDGILKFDNGVKITQIKKGDCIIFNQKYEHEGQSYVDNDKIFIRTEMIFRMPEGMMEKNDYVAKLFNIACYSTKQQLFMEELSNYSSDLFNKHVRIKFHPELINKEVKIKYFYKKINDEVNFITNGNDYYFLSKVDIRHIALIIILDYFNGKWIINNSKKSAKQLFKTKLFSEKITKSNIKKKLTSEKCVKSFDAFFIMKHTSLDEVLEKGIINEGNERHLDCKLGCIYKNGINFKNNEDLEETFENDVNQYRKKITRKNEESLIIMGKHLWININDICIENNKILFKNTGYFSKVNFASCMCEGRDIYDKTINSSILNTFNLPPIYYKKCNGIYHLMIDMFNNNFIARKIKFLSDI